VHFSEQKVMLQRLMACRPKRVVIGHTEFDCMSQRRILWFARMTESRKSQPNGKRLKRWPERLCGWRHPKLEKATRIGASDFHARPAHWIAHAVDLSFGQYHWQMAAAAR